MATAFCTAISTAASAQSTMPATDDTELSRLPDDATAHPGDISEANPPLLPGPRELRIVSWHLEDADAAGAITIQPTPQRIWRHTFGAERRSRSTTNFEIDQLAADVVVIQGVRLLSHVRLLFPARDWRVIVSRQYLRPVLQTETDPKSRGPGWGDALRTPTTAIAVRYQRGVRTAGLEQIIEVVEPNTSGTDGSETAAAVAVRLRVAGNDVWVVSADLPSSCAQDRRCKATAVLAAWQNAHATRATVVIGGRNTHAPAQRPEPQSGCAIQTLTGYPASSAPISASTGQTSAGQPPTHQASRGHNMPKAGCVARLVVTAEGQIH